MRTWLGSLLFVVIGLFVLASGCGSPDVVTGGDGPSNGGSVGDAGSGNNGNGASSGGLIVPGQGGDNGSNCPSTCDDLNANCGTVTDTRCTNVIECGTCPTGQFCGGDGPSRCGTGSGDGGACNGTDCMSCMPKTCADLGFTCGPAGDTCGGKLDCGPNTCPIPGWTCGGGSKLGTCGCKGACSQVPDCSAKPIKTTSLKGRVYDPGGNNPLYHVFVYIANQPDDPDLKTFPKGTTCDVCGATAAGSPALGADGMAGTYTDETGNFTLTNVPVGKGLTVVIQLGRWRRVFQLDVNTPCDVNTVPDKTLLMPSKQSQGNIPLMAMVTGDADSLECVLRKIGIDDSEFTDPAAGGRIQFIEVDLGRYVDYTHLTAMLAPRPALLINNAFDSCCFRADYAPGPLLVAAQPIYSLLGQPGRLRYHANFDQGHNYGLDNRQAFYRFLGEFFFPEGAFSAAERPADLRTPADLRLPLPEPNDDFHTLAVKLNENLPRQPDVPSDPQALARWRTEYRKKLRDLTRWTDYHVTALPTAADAGPGWLFSLNGNWTVPALEFAPENPTGTVLVLGDAGKARLAAEIRGLMEKNQRVIAMDPFYFGECRIENKGYLYALLISALGERPLGIQAGQVAAVARWLRQKYGVVAVEAYGPRTSLIALVAGAVEGGAIREVRLHQPMQSLKEPIQQDMEVSAAPELFCFGLLERFDMKQLAALVAPRPVTTD